MTYTFTAYEVNRFDLPRNLQNMHLRLFVMLTAVELLPLLRRFNYKSVKRFINTPAFGHVTVTIVR